MSVIAPTPIPAMPEPPDRADRNTFSVRATNSFDALKNVTVPGINAIAENMYNNAMYVFGVVESGDVQTVATNIAAVETVAGIAADVTIVAGIDSDVVTVSTNADSIITVSDDIVNVNIVSGGIASVNTNASNIANINIVAGISGNVTTVAGIAGNVTTVATNNANVTIVANNIANVNTAAANIVAIQAAPGAASDAADSAADAAQSAIDAAASAASIAGGPVASINGQTGIVTLDASDVGAEPAITVGSTAQYWRGDKWWRDFATDVRAAVLTGLSTASAVAVAAADSVLVAIGKLQAQLDKKGSINIPLIAASANTTVTKAHAGGGLKHPSADTTARTYTIDSNANQSWEDGTAITFLNQNGAGVITIAVTANTMRLVGAGTTGSRTLAANGLATAIWDAATTTWYINGVGLT